MSKKKKKNRDFHPELLEKFKLKQKRFCIRNKNQFLGPLRVTGGRFPKMATKKSIIFLINLRNLRMKLTDDWLTMATVKLLIALQILVSMLSSYQY